MLVIATVPLAVRPTTSDPVAELAAVSRDVVRAVFAVVLVVVVTLERRLPRPGFAATFGERTAAEVIVGVRKPPALLMTGAAEVTVDVVALAAVFAAVVGDTVIAAVVGVTRPDATAPVVATPLTTAPPLTSPATTSVGSELIERLTVICGFVMFAGLMNCPV